MQRCLRVFSTALLLTALAWLDSQAASTLAFRVRVLPGQRARIYAGDRAVMTIAGHGWKSIESGQVIASRLNSLAEEGLGPGEISIWAERRTRVIAARGERIVTVDRATAASQGVDRATLARIWARNLRQEFGRPYLSVSPLVVPAGESRAIAVKGNIAGPLMVRSAAPIVSVAWDEKSKQVRVTGVGSGRTELIVRDAVSVLQVPVRCAYYAARWVDPIPAAVTGSPASTHIITRAIKAAVGAGMTIEAGAWTQVNPLTSGLTSLWPGRSAIVPTQISAAGPGYLAYHAKPHITVRNESVPTEPARILMVSNSPERLLAHGLWFEGKIGESDRVRFLYHHVNGTKGPADVVVELWNLGSETARVQVVAGTGGPSYDEAWVGHRAAIDFLSNWTSNRGWIVPVPPNTATPVISLLARPGSVASGILELRALGRADLRLRLYLEPPASERTPKDIAYYSESPLLGQWHYPQPRREIRTRYQVGQSWTFITIGDQPAVGLAEGDMLAGSYGVLYDIDLNLENPTNKPAQAAILIEPAGGPARAAVLVDGKPVEAVLLGNTDEGLLARYALAPGEARRVRIQTIPQGGSNYPVRLVARPV